MSQCRATAHRSGERCQRRAIRGTTVCQVHGGAAKQVRRVAAERVALARAAQLLGPDAPDADPGRTLLAAVKASAALLEAAEAAVTAEEADPAALTGLAEAAMNAGRLARLALDAGVEERITRQAERNGELVGTLLTRVLSGLELGPETTARAFNLIRAEIDYGHLDVAQLDGEIARLANELRESDLADAARGFPAKLARAIDAGLAVLDLDDDQREGVTVAVESFLQHEAEQSAQLADDIRSVQRSDEPVQAWWVDSARYRQTPNGGRR